MRDVLAGVDSLVADGLADPERLGVTGGSYGGYLTNWIVGHDDRFRGGDDLPLGQRHDDAVPDRRHQRAATGPSSSSTPRPGSDPAYYREISPITYAERIRTPLLIQHSERDLRTTIGQAEALFTVLRSLKRPVRLLRVPEETHELTRSGTPYRRVENLEIVRDWFQPLPGGRQARDCRRCPRSAAGGSGRAPGVSWRGARVRRLPPGTRLRIAVPPSIESPNTARSSDRRRRRSPAPAATDIVSVEAARGPRQSAATGRAGGLGVGRRRGGLDDDRPRASSDGWRRGRRTTRPRRRN